MAPQDVTGEEILARCGHRALDKLEKTIDEATTRDSSRRSLLDGATPVDKNVLGSLYATATMAGLVVSGFAVYPYYRLSLRTRPVLSVIAGSITGLVAGVVVGFRGIGDAVKELAAQPMRSSIADQILCPTLEEFGPCEQDERCRALLLSSGSKGATLLECAALCRERVRVASLTTQTTASAYDLLHNLLPQAQKWQPPATSKGSNFSRGAQDGHEGEPPDIQLMDSLPPPEADPYFSGGFNKPQQGGGSPRW